MLAVPATYEVLEGIVQQGSDTGIKVTERWCNYDQQHDVMRPKPGERIKLRVRNGRYIVHLVGEGQELPPEPAARRPANGAYRSPEEERRIVRQACLKAAVEWCATVKVVERQPTSTDVLKLAERFEQWVYR
jgi:hypothetical protein